MISIHRVTIYALLLLDVILCVAVINLGAFAQKGPRYTADDGKREREERIQSDLALAARIDLLHNLIAEQGAADATAPSAFP